eukprot:9483899-Pyramimonas_sp.AAC.2
MQGCCTVLEGPDPLPFITKPGVAVLLRGPLPEALGPGALALRGLRPVGRRDGGARSEGASAPRGR